MRSLSSKLILAFVLVTLTGTLLGALLAGLTTTRQFNLFVIDQARDNLVAELADYYAARGSWEGVEDAWRASRTQRSGRGMEMPGAMPLLADVKGTVLIGGMGHRSGSRLSAPELNRGQPITVDGQQVGTVMMGFDDQRRTATAETTFLQRVNQALFIGALGATAVAVLLGIVLARTLTRPIRDLTTATRAVASGQLEQSVPVRSADELGELAISFNQMSADLTQASQLRRQMTADIAHELRTPLSVILGYTEALADGKLTGTIDMYGVMHREAGHLSHLVDDLRMLSLADAGELSLQRREVMVGDLLQQTVLAHQSQAEQQGIILQVVPTPGLPPIQVDPDRIKQVLGNLVGNALRYTPSGGTIILAAVVATAGAESVMPAVELTVADTGVGIDPADLPFIFRRFYRGDVARAQTEAESGLGLAIAKSIVEAHGGTIAVHSTAGAGTTFTISLPGSPV